MILVHDYNTISYQGAQKAVQDYCDAHAISYVPLPDLAGTAVIIK